MKYLIASLCIIFCVQEACAQQIPDQSLTPAQTAQQPNIIHQHDYLNPGTQSTYQNDPGNTYPRDNYGQQQPYPNDGYDQNDSDLADGTSQRREFMDIFCDPNIKPVAVSASMQSCIESTRQDACATFQRLPGDVQSVLDRQIGCIHSSTDADGNLITNPSCGDDDHRRLVLLKKYWRDQDTSSALVFLPDKVLNGSAQCVHSNGGY